MVVIKYNFGKVKVGNAFMHLQIFQKNVAIIPIFQFVCPIFSEIVLNFLFIHFLKIFYKNGISYNLYLLLHINILLLLAQQFQLTAFAFMQNSEMCLSFSSICLSPRSCVKSRSINPLPKCSWIFGLSLLLY